MRIIFFALASFVVAYICGYSLLFHGKLDDLGAVCLLLFSFGVAVIATCCYIQD